MHLWNEYEGRTIAGSYTLGKLLRSEGRNGFFSTATDKGNSAVIRITEAHFDEEEQLNRWRQVAEVHQTNLIEIENMGKTTFDGVALTYALMEPNDANLGDVLKERPLTPAETQEVARSVLAALRALHGTGLVHEHIEPANVLAVGDVVKLRSDCIRECVADVEFNTPEGCAELRKRDLHAYGVLLLQCLTLEKEWTPSTNLPEPFKRVIPRALDGSWTLEQVAAVIDPSSVVPKGVTATAPVRLPPAANGTGAPQIAPQLGFQTAPQTGSQMASQIAQPLVPQSVRLATAANLAARDTIQADRTPEPAAHLRSRDLLEEPAASRISMKMIWAICAASALVLVLLIWHFVAKPANPAAVAAAPLSQSATAPLSQSAAASGREAQSSAAATTVPQSSGPTAAAPAAIAPTRSAPATAASSTASGPGWYVIAFTYNHAGQAQTKADRINHRRAGLHAEVFSPSGRPPYLVSLNGPMNQNEAEAVWRRARRSGMPRDTFLRHY